MSKLYFITHPSVQIEKDKPIEEWGLSEKGFEETKRLLELDFWDEISAIYSSREKKAIHTAEIVAKKINLNLIVKKCLTEIDRSATGFLEYDEYIKTVKQFYMSPNVSVNGWESANSATERIASCVKTIMESQNHTVAIVGHGATGTLLACYLQGVEPNYDEDPQGTGRYMIVDWQNSRILQKWQIY